MGENITAIEIKKEKLKEAYKTKGRKEKIKRLEESIKRHKQIAKSIRFKRNKRKLKGGKNK